ncbi:MAG TPA: protoporphyrinogen oxidase [Bacteroides sp.]|nr:protoporphyrinogen oxidase [Bacteroides sp.]
MIEGRKDCVIIGAGITGLTSAYYLNKAGKNFLVLEEKDRVGGVIRTIREDGFLFETGPNTGVLGQPEAAMLFEDLEGAVELEVASSSVKKRYILKGGQWHALPSGLGEAIQTPLFTLKDKFRILAEPFRSRGTDPEETLKNLVIRRMGKSYLEYAVDPFILGVYAGDPGQLIPKYALPKLYNLEQQYGSFIGGAVKKKLKKKNTHEEKATREIFSCKGGLQSLVDSLYEKSGPENYILSTRGTTVHGQGKGFMVEFTTDKGVAEKCLTDQVIVTTGSEKLSRLLPDIDHETMARLTDIRYARVIEAAVGFRHWKGMNPDGFGGLIPFKEERDLLGILFPSAFLEGRAPEGAALFTVFVGGIRRPELFELNDQGLSDLIGREFTDLMGIDRFDPDLFRTFRYQWAIPQYEKSSGSRFDAVRQVEARYPGLFLRGNFQGGIGLADRIRQGRLAAENTINM